MKKKKALNVLSLLIVISIIIASIWYLETSSLKQRTTSSSHFTLGDITNDQGFPRAPELLDGGQWINSDGETLENLKGRVVLLEFWTSSCQNCRASIPHLKKFHQTYKDQGLVIIGVHTPEFEYEKDINVVTKTIDEFQIPYTVVQDNDYNIWRAYKNRFWPRTYLIDKDGFVRYDVIGEGAHEVTEQNIIELLAEEQA